MCITKPSAVAVDLPAFGGVLRLQAVEEELKLLFETPSLSPDAQARGKALMGTQARLKAQLAQRQSADRR